MKKVDEGFDALQIYNRKEYFLDEGLEGYEEFKKKELSAVKSKQLTMLELEKGIRLLDVGFGRGEVLYHCAKRGVSVAGIDCSQAALGIAKETLHEFPQADIRVADCRKLPFGDHSFERVFSGDVIEHLYYEGGVEMLKEMKRVLKPGGFILLHTSPNTVFIKLIYPFARHILRFIDANAVRKIDYQRKYDTKHIHVHEFNLFSLRKMAREAGLAGATVWIDSDILRSGQNKYTKLIAENSLMKFVGSLGKYSIIRFFLGNDLYLRYDKSS